MELKEKLTASNENFLSHLPGDAGERNQSYRLLFENLPNGFAYCQVITDAGGVCIDLMFREVNPAFTRITGCRREELINRRFSEVWPLAQELLLHLIAVRERAVDTGQAVRCERRLNILGRWLSITAFSPCDGYFALLLDDITVQKEVEKQLRRQNEYLSVLQETSLGLVNRLNVNDLLRMVVAKAGALVGTGNGFLYLLKEAEQVLELRVTTGMHSRVPSRLLMKGEGLSGKIWDTGQLLLVPDYSTWPHRLRDCRLDDARAMVGVPLKLGQQVIGVLGLTHTEANRTFSEAETSILGRLADLASIAIDYARLFAKAQSELNERMRMESALRQSEERYRLLFNSTIDAIFVWGLEEDGLPGRIVEANDVACQRLGYTREELMQFTPVELLAEKPDNIRELMNKLFTSKHLLVERLHVAKDSRIIPVEINSHLFTLNNRQVVLSVARDITERKQMAEEMARLDRLSIIGSMAASIGHEVRNPMTTVRGFLQMLINKPECRSYREFYRIMIEEIDRANGIITEFLSLAKTKAVNLRLSNLNTVIKAIVPLIQADAIVYDKTVRLDLEPVPDIPLDEKEIRQLILNLARNGLDAIPEGKTLTIRSFVKDNEVVLAVADQGKGIEAEILKKLGTPFFSTKENGTGLGLAVCYSIAARHKASIKIDTGPQGSVFSVCFKISG